MNLTVSEIAIKPIDLHTAANQTRNIGVVSLAVPGLVEAIATAPLQSALQCATRTVTHDKHCSLALGLFVKVVNTDSSVASVVFGFALR